MKLQSLIVIASGILIGCAVAKPPASTGNSTNGTAETMKTFAAQQEAGSGKPLNLVPKGPSVSDSARPQPRVNVRAPKQATISKESAIERARAALKYAGELKPSTLGSVTLTKLIDSGQSYGGGVIGSGDQQENDPVWVIRFNGEFKQSGGNHSAMTFVMDANSGEFFTVSQPGPGSAPN